MTTIHRPSTLPSLSPMKTIKQNAQLLLTVSVGALALTLAAPSARAAADHDHAAGDHAGHGHAKTTPAKKVAGPNGGRVLKEVEPHAEFFVTPERKVRVTFLGEDLKPIAPAAQIVSVTTGDRAAPTTLTFEREGNGLLSTTALPAGKSMPVIVHIRGGDDTKPAFARFTLNLAPCPECDLAEYACICAH